LHDGRVLDAVRSLRELAQNPERCLADPRFAVQVVEVSEFLLTNFFHKDSVEDFRALTQAFKSYVIDKYFGSFGAFKDIMWINSDNPLLHAVRRFTDPVLPPPVSYRGKLRFNQYPKFLQSLQGLHHFFSSGSWTIPLIDFAGLDLSADLIALISLAEESNPLASHALIFEIVLEVASHVSSDLRRLSLFFSSIETVCSTKQLPPHLRTRLLRMRQDLCFVLRIFSI
jgi:hypothetical protein